MRALIRNLILCVGVASETVALAAPAPSKVDPQEHFQAAAKEHKHGDSQKALQLVEQGLAVAPKNLKLLGLKGALLVELRDYVGALAAYQAYLAAGATGANQREAQKIVEKLRAVQTTFLEIELTNGPADIFLDSRTLGVLCEAAPSCRKAILPAEYTVIIERPGFERWVQRVNIEKSKATKLVVRLLEKPSLLTVRVTPGAATVMIDGVVHRPASPLPAGSHLVVVARPGYAEVRREIVASEGKPIELDVVLIRLEKPHAKTGMTGRRKLALAVGGASALAAGAGALLGLQFRRLDKETYKTCPSPSISCPEASLANELNRRSRARALHANIAFGAAGGAAITAVVLWFTGTSEPPVTVTPHLGPILGLDLAARF